MRRRVFFNRNWFRCLLLGGLSAIVFPTAAESAEQAKQPIYFTLTSHECGPYVRGATGPDGRFHAVGEPLPVSVDLKWRVDTLEKFGFRDEMAFTYTCLEQLQEDFPETVEKIKRLQMPIFYHGGPGHTRPNPNGFEREVDTSNISKEEAWRETTRASWEFETHRLYPDWHWEGNQVIPGNPNSGQPFPNDFGGWMAIQRVLGVTPLGATRTNEVLKALGAGSYQQSPSRMPADVRRLPSLSEPYFLPGSAGVPPKYYGYKIGEKAPATADPVDWLKCIRDNFPRQYPYFQTSMLHAGSLAPEKSREIYIRVLNFLKENQADFQVVWSDPAGDQWKPENSPANFCKKTYAAGRLEDMLALPVPYDTIAKFREETDPSKSEQPPGSSGTRPRTPPWKSGGAKRTRSYTLDQNDLLNAADYVLTHWPSGSHDGDFGGPPDFVDCGTMKLSLSDAFAGLAFALRDYTHNNQLPEKVESKAVNGPVDFPTYKLKKEPWLEKRKVTGYTPSELDLEDFPDPELVRRQGLPSGGDYHIWMPVHTIASEEDVLYSACKAADFIQKHGRVPGEIPLALPREDMRGQAPEKALMVVNPAEFLYTLAQEYRVIKANGRIGPVLLVSMKLMADQTCKLIMPSSPFWQYGSFVGQFARLEGFIWRAYVSPKDINAAWTYVPAASTS